MGGQWFDDLTKALAAGASRRRVLRGLVGAAAGGLGLAVGRGAEAAVPRPAGATCVRNGHCASGLCDPARRRCVCPGGQAVCQGACVDPATFQTDPANCGACGNACPGTVCSAGVCQAPECLAEGVPCIAIPLPCCPGLDCFAGVCLPNNLPNQSPCGTGSQCASGNCARDDGNPDVFICCDPGAFGCNGICCPSGTSCEPGPSCVE